MGRAINRLSVKEAQKNLDPGLYGDGGGLYLQVSASRTKSWVFRFMVGRRPRKMGLGDYPRVSLADARDAARDAYKLVRAGSDPIEVRQRANSEATQRRAKALTFRQCAEAYIAQQHAHWTNEKHAQQWENTLATYAYPRIGHLMVQDVDVPSVLTVIEPIWSDKTETASRLRGRIETILNWARARGLRSGENPATWRGNLQEALPKILLSQRVKHHPAMPYRDVPAFIGELRAARGISARALEYTILTAARTSETLLAKWPEIDLEQRMWIRPAEHMKGKREHRVPLSDAALDLLQALPRDETSDYIFPGMRVGRPLSQMAMLEQLRGMRSSVVVHGFRSSFRDWAAEQTAYANELVEMALAHLVSDKTEAAYRRGDMVDRRRRLMEEWSDYCARRHGNSGNVVAMRANQ